MENKIFEYELSNAWGMPLWSLTVYNSTSDNVKCIVWNVSEAPKSLPLNSNYTLSSSVIDKVINIIDSYPQLMNIDEVEFPPVLDGWRNEFYFANYKADHEIEASNLWYFVENSETIEEKEPVNAKLILNVFQHIKDILIQNGVDERYLLLDLE